MKIAPDITALIGNTPLVKLNRVTDGCKAEVAAKLEFFNPLSSVKDRIGVNMIRTALKDGKINKDTIIVEPTSGNTGIGLAFTCAAMGIPLVIYMPENMSIERRRIMEALGACVNLTSATEGMPGAIEAARRFCDENGNTYMPQQFENPANPQIHRETTGPEIWNDTDGKINILVCGVGTGGTITGTGEYLKGMKPGVEVVAVEPEGSQVLSGGEKGKHIIQGIGAGFIPKILNPEIIDRVIRVKDENAVQMQKDLSGKEGIFAGLSSGAAVSAAVEEARKEENRGKLIVVVLPDTGERYLTSEWF